MEMDRDTQLLFFRRKSMERALRIRAMQDIIDRKDEQIEELNKEIDSRVRQAQSNRTQIRKLQERLRELEELMDEPSVLYLVPPIKED